MASTGNIFGNPFTHAFAARGGVVRRCRMAFAFAAFLAGSMLQAEEISARELPGFLFQPLYASNQGSVYGVSSARHADLVLVQGGFDAGFRAGMVCRVLDEAGEVGEVMLAEVRENCAAAIILQLEAGKLIEAGQTVRIKTVKF